MIPASFTGHPSVVAPRKNIAIRSPRLSARAATGIGLAAAAKPAAFAQSQPNQSRALSANTPQPHSVLVLVHTEQIDKDADGRIWSISVWHLTVFHPVDGNSGQEVRKEISPKST
jgi:hypothetical protein